MRSLQTDLRPIPHCIHEALARPTWWGWGLGFFYKDQMFKVNKLIITWLLLCFCKLVISPWALQENNALQFKWGGGCDNSNKRCFGTKPKLFRESGDFSRNLDNWKFFRETHINSATLQKEIGTSKEILFHVSQQFGRMIQISGMSHDLSEDLVLHVILLMHFSELRAPVI